MPSSETRRRRGRREVPPRRETTRRAWRRKPHADSEIGIAPADAAFGEQDVGGVGDRGERGGREARRRPGGRVCQICDDHGRGRSSASASATQMRAAHLLRRRRSAPRARRGSARRTGPRARCRSRRDGSRRSTTTGRARARRRRARRSAGARRGAECGATQVAWRAAISRQAEERAGAADLRQLLASRSPSRG